MVDYPFLGWSQGTREGGISVSLPVFKGYPTSLRWPLPCMIVTVSTDEQAEAVKRLEDQIKAELNVKQIQINTNKGGNYNGSRRMGND